MAFWFWPAFSELVNYVQHRPLHPSLYIHHLRTSYLTDFKAATRRGIPYGGWLLVVAGREYLHGKQCVVGNIDFFRIDSNSANDSGKLIMWWCYSKVTYPASRKFSLTSVVKLITMVKLTFLLAQLVTQSSTIKFFWIVWQFFFSLWKGISCSPPDEWWRLQEFSESQWKYKRNWQPLCIYHIRHMCMPGIETNLMITVCNIFKWLWYTTAVHP